MSLITKPNAWVNVQDNPATQLTYGPRVNPAPLTVSVPERDPTLGALVVVITNQTPEDLAISSVTFRILVGEPGKDGSPLMPTTAGVKVEVSDTTTWSFWGPASPVASGVADYVLAPVVGDSAVLAAGESVDVQIYDFETVAVPSTTTITIKEQIAGRELALTAFLVSTFPDGFYFDSLTANAQSGSELVPVAQVVNGSSVTLSWNSSVVDVEAQTVHYSDAAHGQQTATPSVLGEWSSPPLTSDTVFSVSVVAKGYGGEPLIVGLSTAVSVQNPSLVARSLNTGAATVNGDAWIGGSLNANTIAAAGLEVNGVVIATGVNVSGTLSAGAAAVYGALSAGSATVNGPLTATTATVNGSLRASSIRADSGVATSGLDARLGSVSLVTSAQGMPTGQYLAKTDGFAIGTVGWPSSSKPGCVGYARGQAGGMVVCATGGNLGAFGPYWSSAQASNANTFMLPVASGNYFALEAWQVSGDLKQAEAPIWFYWVPLGKAAAAAATVERVGDPPEELEPPPLPSAAELLCVAEEEDAEQPSESDRSSAEEVIALLEPFLSRSLDKRAKKDLARALQGL